MSRLLHVHTRRAAQLTSGSFTDCEVHDDLTGVQLDKTSTVQARKEEVFYFKKRRVHTKRKKKSWMQVISTKLVDLI